MDSAAAWKADTQEKLENDGQCTACRAGEYREVHRAVWLQIQAPLGFRRSSDLPAEFREHRNKSMLTFTKAVKTSDGQTFENLADAQAHELEKLLTQTEDPNSLLDDISLIVKRIMNQSEKVADILTTTPTSKPSARRVNGGKKTRKPATTEATV